MSLIKPEAKINKTELKVKLPNDIKDAMKRYCDWAQIDDVGHLVAESVKYIFSRDKEWQKYCQQNADTA